MFARGGRIGHVTVDSDDAWGMVAEHESAPVLTLQLNYLDRPARRRLLVNTADTTIEADLIARTLTIDGETTGFATEADDTYRRLHVAMLDGTGPAPATVADAVATDELIGMIELSATTRRWVPRP